MQENPFDDDPFGASGWVCPDCGHEFCQCDTARGTRVPMWVRITGLVVVISMVVGGIGFVVGARGEQEDVPATATPLSSVPRAGLSPDGSTTSVPSSTGPTSTGDVALASDEQLMLDLVNAERGNIGLPALEWCPLVAVAARLHSQDMASRDFYDHVSPEGDEVWDRVTAQGYTYSSVGENIAVGYESVREVMKGWMNSKGHRENILEEGYTHFGYGRAVGTYKGDSNYTYWTQNFGSGGPCT